MKIQAIRRTDRHHWGSFAQVALRREKAGLRNGTKQVRRF